MWMQYSVENVALLCRNHCSSIKQCRASLADERNKERKKKLGIFHSPVWHVKIVCSNT